METLLIELKIDAVVNKCEVATIICIIELRRFDRWQEF